MAPAMGSAKSRARDLMVLLLRGKSLWFLLKLFNSIGSVDLAREAAAGRLGIEQGACQEPCLGSRIWLRESEDLWEWHSFCSYPQAGRARPPRALSPNTGCSTHFKEIYAS